ncbi:MAG: periplasmic heavy metal sensor [Chloroflexi bacterium]|nr:periplasmic heavy metal sensor [Chloroflexota bacterium]
MAARPSGSALVRRRFLLTFLLVALMAFPVVARAPASMAPARIERIIEALLIWRLVDELDLSEQQIARIFPQIKALKELRLELGRRKRALESELRRALARRPPDEEAIKAAVAQLQALREETEQRRQHILRQIHAALTVEQQARFALIDERFEAETLRLLEEVRRLAEQPARQ